MEGHPPNSSGLLSVGREHLSPASLLLLWPASVPLTAVSGSSVEPHWGDCSSAEGVECSSTMKKRRKKMNKHKWKKRRARDRKRS